MKMRIEQLTGWQDNPRTISTAAAEGLRASIERFGCVQDPVWNRRTGRLVAGHQRVAVLRSMGEVEVEVKVVDLDEDDEIALNLTLNNMQISGTFEPELLAKAMERIPRDADFFRLRLHDLDRVFLDVEMEPLPPSEPETADVKVGSVVEIGDHRVFVGDCAVARQKFPRCDMAFVDPPFEIKDGWLEHVQDPSIVCGNVAMMRKLGEEWRSEYVLIKPSPHRVQDMYMVEHVIVGLYGSSVKMKADGSSVYRITRKDERHLRKHEKPWAFTAYLLRNHFPGVKTIWEPFCGSIQTMLAASRRGAVVYGSEINPERVVQMQLDWAAGHPTAGRSL